MGCMAGLESRKGKLIEDISEGAAPVGLGAPVTQEDVVTILETWIQNNNNKKKKQKTKTHQRDPFHARCGAKGLLSMMCSCTGRSLAAAEILGDC